MKKQFVALSVAAVLAGLGMASMAQAADPVTTAGGKVHFVGEVVDAACAVSSDSVDQTVILDQVRAVKLGTKDQLAGQPKSFTIKLVDCDVSTYTNASVSFTGQTDAVAKTALANTAGAGAATNVALQMFGPDSAKLDMGTDSSAIVLKSGTNEIPLSVDYVATDAATTGAVEATATFHITYS